VVFSIEKSKHEEANEIIRVLASLCSAEQLQYSTLLVQEQRFIPDLYLQGLDEMPLQDDLFECAFRRPAQYVGNALVSGVQTW
jgi:hypothetical protein